MDTPTSAQVKLEKREINKNMVDNPYRQAVGSLMYLMIGSRPDIAFAVQNVSQFLNCYDESH